MQSTNYMQIIPFTQEQAQRYALSHLRYEFLRTLDDDGFSELLALKSWCGISLDEAVDRMRKERPNG